MMSNAHNAHDSIPKGSLMLVKMAISGTACSAQLSIKDPGLVLT